MRETLPLLMTSSVSTRGMKGACFTCAEREEMYAGALAFYCDNLLDKNPGQTIVFAENSGWDLSSLKRRVKPRHAGRVEFITLPPEDFDISKGKGYNELLMITKAVEKSKFIGQAGAFFKVTGRYPIYNIGYFLNAAAKSLWRDGRDIYCDIKDHKIYDWLRLGWCGHSFDCRLFGVKTEYYLSQMAPHYTECDDYNGSLLENVLFKNVKNGGVEPRADLNGSHISAA